MNTSHPHCPMCAQGSFLPATFVRSFEPRGRQIDVELLTSRCNQCGFESPRAAQQKENLVRLAARKKRPEYEGLLLGEEILRLRKTYGLTQQAASKIFGKGKIAFSRYENEVTYPDLSTTLLLTLALKSRANMVWLADMAGVELPLLSEREDEARAVVTLASSKPTSWEHPMEKLLSASLTLQKKVTECVRMLASNPGDKVFDNDKNLEFFG